MSKKSIDGLQVSRFRLLGNARRYVRALVLHILPTRTTYASNGEDATLLELLAPYDLDDAIYVDVGANDPVYISNTYLFYRRGHYGVCIDPNPEMAALYDLFRPRDVFVAAACSSGFHFQRLAGPATTTSSLTRDSESPFGRWVAVAPLDEILAGLGNKAIFLLSIDTEGHELAVLQGARHALIRAQFVLAETTSPDSDSTITDLMSQYAYELVRRVGLNLLFKSRRSVLPPSKHRVARG
jgi:FkbM family methyltransferase